VTTSKVLAERTDLPPTVRADGLASRHPSWLASARAGARPDLSRVEDVRQQVLRHYDDVSSERIAYVPNELLSRLVGCRLYSIEFVMDYVELRFDGPTEDMPILNCDVLPVVETPSGSMAPGQVGWADALRDLIAEQVVATAERTGQGLRIEFDGGAIRLHPEIDHETGPEIALLTGFKDGRWMCWRPGEVSFEDVV
jgi:hypothetical protein